MEFCRSRILNGDDASINKDVILGRVINLEHYCDILIKERIFLDVYEAKSFIELLIDTAVVSIPEHWKSMPMGKHAMWATFDQNGERPFGNDPPPARAILCVLGIKASAGPHLVLEYQLPPSIPAKIPTFADAYADSHWAMYFRPAIPRQSCGLTKPTEDCHTDVGRPEVVHDIIKIEALSFPMRYV
jgi:hypothetical protein